MYNMKMKLNSKLSKKILATTGGVFVSSLAILSGAKNSNPVEEVQTIEDFYANKNSQEDMDLYENEVFVSKEEEEEVDERLQDLVEIDEAKAFVNKETAEIFEIKEEELTEASLKLFDEILITHENNEFYKGVIEEKEILIGKLDVSKNRNNVFREVEDVVRYMKEDTSLFKEPNNDSEKVSAGINEEVKVLGYNEMGFARVNYKGDTLYAKTDILAEEKASLEVIKSSVANVEVKSSGVSNDTDNKNNVVKSENKDSQKVEAPKTKVVKKVRKVPKKEKANNAVSNDVVPKKADANATKQEIISTGETYNCSFSAYYPANTRLQGGFKDALGKPLVPANNTCAAPKEIPFGTKILVQGTGTSKDGKIFTVTDRGGAIKMQPNGTWRVDILTHNYNEAYGFGRRTGTVTIVK